MAASSPKVTWTSFSWPPLFTVRVTVSPGFLVRTSSMRSLALSTGWPSKAVMMSPGTIPAAAAPEFSDTPAT